LPLAAKRRHTGNEINWQPRPPEKQEPIMQLQSRHYDAPDMAAAMELCDAKGWTDGLPAVPPRA
jgi:hypothetical protein